MPRFMPAFHPIPHFVYLFFYYTFTRMHFQEAALTRNILFLASFTPCPISCPLLASYHIVHSLLTPCHIVRAFDIVPNFKPGFLHHAVFDTLPAVYVGFT